jgi:hypothetical protein
MITNLVSGGKTEVMAEIEGPYYGRVDDVYFIVVESVMSLRGMHEYYNIESALCDIFGLEEIKKSSLRRLFQDALSKAAGRRGV